jgi:hypothetical protein
MKTVLIVSYLFPPVNTIGAVRIGKLAKYLPEFGWTPVILTSITTDSMPQSLPVEIPSSQVIRTLSYSIYSKIVGESSEICRNSLRTPSSSNTNTILKLRVILVSLLRSIKFIYSLPLIDRLISFQFGWKTKAIKAGNNYIEKNKIDALFSSFGPSVSHIVASNIQRKAKIPWIAEYRDPWSQSEYLRMIQPFQCIEELWEKKTLKNASLIVTVSNTFAQRLEYLHSKPTIVIPNGFDEEDYYEEISQTDKFTITYTGNIYPGKRDPEPLLKAIALLKRAGKIKPDNFELRFFGNNVKQCLNNLVDKYDINNLVILNGPISFKESIERQKESSVLLLLSWNDPKDVGTLTGKIYEYLGAKRPILALAYEGGEIARLLHETSCGVVVNDLEGIKNVITKWLEEYQFNQKIKSYYAPNNDMITKYTRREQARHLAEALDAITV